MGTVKAEERRRLQPSVLQALPLPSQVTVGGPSWPTFGRLDPYGRGQGGGDGGDGGRGGGKTWPSVAWLLRARPPL